MTLSNADRIRNMTDEELNYFLWTVKINHLRLFFNYKFEQTMNAKEQLEWLQKEGGFIVPETTVDKDMVYDQDFHIKEDKT